MLGIRSKHVWTLHQGEPVCPLILLVFYCLFAYLHIYAHTILIEEYAGKPVNADCCILRLGYAHEKM